MAVLAECCCSTYFYPRPPRGGRHTTTPSLSQAWIFLSTPSARRATENDTGPWVQTQISIHALREEGDHTQGTTHTPGRYFYPRPPRGGRHDYFVRKAKELKISIHALREEGDLIQQANVQTLRISIHALREEGDRSCRRYDPAYRKFLSTPSARRATERKGRKR